MTSVLLAITGLAAFVVFWNVLWGPTPKGTPWSVYMPRVLWTAAIMWLVMVAIAAFAWISLAAAEYRMVPVGPVPVYVPADLP